MSFWDINPQEVTGEYVQDGGGSFDPIPNDTNVMGFIDQIGWATGRTDGSCPIEYRINVVKPEAYKNRKLFFKFWIKGDNPQKEGEKQKKEGATAARKFYNIDAQFGGELLKLRREPTDEDMQRHMMNKMCVFKIGMYDMPKSDGSGERNKGNYLMGVCAKGADVPETPAPQPKRQEPGRVANGTSRYDTDTDIPF